MKLVIRFALVAAPAAFALAACATPETAPTAAQASAAPGGPVVLQPTCPARDLQGLIGRDRSVLSTMRFAGPVRIEEPGQAFTMDFQAGRTRIILAPNGRIDRVLCG